MTNKEAKRILQFCICVPMKTDEQREAFNLAIKALEERPQGKWIFSRCDQCGAYHNSMYRNFCPNCGADMRGDNNG